MTAYTVVAMTAAETLGLHLLLLGTKGKSLLLTLGGRIFVR